VYQREESHSWNYDFVGRVMAPDAAYMDYFGASVAIVDDLYVVGAHLDDNGLDYDTGGGWTGLSCAGLCWAVLSCAVV
jgi:hypothetical protein